MFGCGTPALPMQPLQVAMQEGGGADGACAMARGLWRGWVTDGGSGSTASGECQNQNTKNGTELNNERCKLLLRTHAAQAPCTACVLGEGGDARRRATPWPNNCMSRSPAWQSDECQKKIPKMALINT